MTTVSSNPLAYIAGMVSVRRRTDCSLVVEEEEENKLNKRATAVRPAVCFNTEKGDDSTEDVNDNKTEIRNTTKQRHFSKAESVELSENTAREVKVELLSSGNESFKSSSEFPLRTVVNDVPKVNSSKNSDICVSSTLLHESYPRRTVTEKSPENRLSKVKRKNSALSQNRRTSKRSCSRGVNSTQLKEAVIVMNDSMQFIPKIPEESNTLVLDTPSKEEAFADFSFVTEETLSCAATIAVPNHAELKQEEAAKRREELLRQKVEKQRREDERRQQKLAAAKSSKTHADVLQPTLQHKGASALKNSSRHLAAKAVKPVEMTQNKVSKVVNKVETASQNYDIADLSSGDETDDEEKPKKRVPSWATGEQLKARLIYDYYNPPDFNKIFRIETLPQEDSGPDEIPAQRRRANSARAGEIEIETEVQPAATL
ncbi:unnamed protein product [Soboliphyme baturini]|uniref:INCENP_ARK-bind domain-containing protein n=1 Tax=Soboliphyme baturini TaxID=241478 RepID=A0A183INE9_9BILA|nr:unnamed protein product [Soboliphyme baturini]